MVHRFADDYRPCMTSSHCGDYWTPNRRRRPRFSMTARVVIGSLAGFTRDMSADAVCFDVPAEVARERRLRFSIFFDGPGDGHPHVLKCEGSVIRAEEHAGGWTMAVTLDACDLELLAESSASRACSRVPGRDTSRTIDIPQNIPAEESSMYGVAPILTT